MGSVPVMSRLFSRTGFLARVCTTLLVAALALGALSHDADAKTKKRKSHRAPVTSTLPDRYASIVIDANSGKVLYSRNSDAYRYPASLTKMMTLYMTFEAVSAGRMSMDDQITVSAAAASAAPSKLGLRAGDTISVHDAVLALITKSANDAAVALAEHHASSESAFAEMMTTKAKSIGMTHTTFRNASGLPNPGQRTTARDLAMLGQALIVNYPQYYGLFSTKDFTWKGSKIPNHDRLLASYEGTTGLKTGYTAASGFNLATSVERNGYRLIGIVMGGRTAKSRDDHMKQILDMQWARLEGDPLLASRTLGAPTIMVAQAATPAPAPTSVIPVPTQRALIGTNPTAPVALASAAPAIAPAQLQPVPRARTEITVASAPTRPTSKPAIKEAGFSPVGDPIGDAIAALASSGTRAPAARSNTQLASVEAEEEVGEGDVDEEAARTIDWLSGDQQQWGIQIGAFTAMEKAASRLSAAAAAAPEQLKAATPAIVSTAGTNGPVYKARFGPFEEQQARNACTALTAHGISCLPVHEDAP